MTGSICAATSLETSSWTERGSSAERSNRRAQTTWLSSLRSSKRNVMRNLLRLRWIAPSSRKSRPLARLVAEVRSRISRANGASEFEEITVSQRNLDSAVVISLARLGPR
jgi:hypothetical protein